MYINVNSGLSVLFMITAHLQSMAELDKISCVKGRF